ncbi:MAG: diguanylate cyclase [Planctomycetota bacterium]|nr:MAG: diguanylate cyclase [Planctomycetota bacterium]
MATDDFFAGLDETKEALKQKSRESVAADRWRVLYEISSLFNSPVYTFEEILEIILSMAIKITEADRGLLLLYDSSDQLKVKLAKDMDFSTLPKEEREVSENVIEDVVKREQGICIANVEQDEKFSELSSIIDLKILSVMCVPLKVTLRDDRAGGKEHRAVSTLVTRKILGVLYVDSRSVSKSFSRDDLELFQALANNATTAILNSNLYRLATCDPATGIYTRHHFEQRLRDEVKLARKSKSPLSLLMVDIDHLRRINEERGYVEADKVIARVAGLIQENLRGIDLVARYGGGKFVVILPQTGQQGTEAVANKILGAVAGETFFGRIGSITCSVGAAELDKHMTTAGLVRRADLALYDAKQSGRNTYRPYHDALMGTAKRTDRLAGVLSGDPTRDYRNTLMLLETIETIHAQGTDFDNLLPHVVDIIVDITQAERGILLLRDEDGNLTPRVARDRKKNDIEPKDFSRSVVDRVISTDQPVREAFSDDGAESTASISNFSIRAVMCVPLTITEPNGSSRTFGAIYVDSQLGGSEFDESSLAFFSTLSRQVAQALENARLYGRVAALNRQLQAKLDTTERELHEVRVELEDRTKSLELRYTYDNIVGRSPRMQEVFRLLDRVTDTSVPVFIHGESGTGKELVAKAIHYNGPRKKFRMISENCAATSETLLESELFGYVKGAFTGANSDRKGLFEMANKGTLFLDEIGDMSMGMQKKLLRVLQEGEIRRVGGKDTIQVDVRIVSASNKDLKTLVEQGKFREDLYYRLNVVKVELPPLRERKEDLPLLIDYFLKQEGSGPAKRFDSEAMQLLMRYNWPGNIRELKNVVERAKIISDGDVMTKEHVILDTVFDPRQQAGLAGVAPPGRVPGPRGAPLPAPPGMSSLPPEPYYFDLNERQRKLIEYLKTYGSIRNRDYYEIMQVSKSTGWRDIKDLIRRGIVQAHGKGKGSIYTLKEQES